VLACDHGFIKKYNLFVHLLFSCCYRHLQLIIVITKNLYSIMDRATEALNIWGLFRSLGQ